MKAQCVLSVGNSKDILKELKFWVAEENCSYVKSDRVLDILPWRDRILLQ